MQRTVIFVGQLPANHATQVGDAMQRCGLHLEIFAGVDDAEHYARSVAEDGEPALALMIGQDVPRILKVARRLYRSTPQSYVIFLRDEDKMDKLRQEIGIAPLIGSYWAIASPEADDLERLLRDAIRSTRQRRLFRTTLDRNNVKLATRAPADSPDYRRLVISDRYLASILTHAHDAIVSTDNNGTILTWNLAAEKLLGYTADDVVGRSLDSFVSRDQKTSSVSELVHSLSRGESEIRREMCFFHLDGSALDVEATLAPVRDEAGRQIGISLIARDITERRRAEEALRSSEKLAATGRLAATIAHEINNPLESITNLLYLLEHHRGIDNDAREYAHLAQKEVGRVAHIARQMLGFYREASTPVPVNLRSIVENVVELYSRKAAMLNTQVSCRCEYEGEIQAFPAEMRQVFSNLVVNALEAAGKNGKVLIRITRSHDWSSLNRGGVRVTVLDTGTGITEQNRRRIFEPFFTTKGEKGTGLGLWVTRGIVQKHGGHIRVHSSTAAGKSGTAFSVFLPALYAQRVQQPAENKAAAGSLKLA